MSTGKKINTENNTRWRVHQLRNTSNVGGCNAWHNLMYMYTDMLKSWFSQNQATVVPRHQANAWFLNCTVALWLLAILSTSPNQEILIVLTGFQGTQIADGGWAPQIIGNNKDHFIPKWHKNKNNNQTIYAKIRFLQLTPPLPPCALPLALQQSLDRMEHGHLHIKKMHPQITNAFVAVRPSHAMDACQSTSLSAM